MRPPVAVSIALVFLLAAVTLGYLTTERGGHAAASSAPAARPATPAGAPPPGTTQTAAVRPRAGKVLPLETALRELELIRPARPKAAEDFVLPTHGGGKVRLSEHRGRVVLINFWATWCPPCLEEMPAMERLYRQHKDAGFTLIAVSVDADPKKVGPFVSQHGLTFPIGLDPRMELANSYGVRALPSSFVVGRDGRLAALAIGPRAWDNDAAHSLVEGLARQP
jgi:peroxiredoxin